MESAPSASRISPLLTVETLVPTPALPESIRATRNTSSPRWPRLLAAGVACAINVLAIAGLAHLRAIPADTTARPDRLEAWLIIDAPKSESPALRPGTITTQLVLEPPEMPPAAVADDAGMTGLSPPRMDSRSSPDFDEFSKTAGTAAGEIATVVILVDVDARGRVTHATIVRSTGGPGTDTSALAYARRTRWIPGNIAGTPRAMQASLTLVFGMGGRYDSRPPPAVSGSS